jgi:uncharacterized protein involved in type VI secretion and phage assembly
MPDINTKKDLDDLVKAEKSRAVGEMLIIRGETQTCKVKIGSAVRVRFPKRMQIELKSVDSFLVTQVTHVVDQDGRYSNSFSGIIDEIEVIPMAEPKISIAGSQIATVKSNDDPKKQGRVKVQTLWQNTKNKTTGWLRVQAPDAGSSEKVSGNRGLVTIPEIGDTVMLGFEFNNPDRPFVAGSIFTSKTGTGGGDANKTKSLTTRSGSTISLDDSDGSLYIKDKHGSDSKIKLDGNQNMTIETDNSIIINIGKGKSILKMDKEGNIDIEGKTINVKASDAIHLNSEKYLELEGKNNTEVVSDKKVLVQAQSEDVSILGSGGKIKVQNGEVDIN